MLSVQLCPTVCIERSKFEVPEGTTEETGEEQQQEQELKRLASPRAGSPTICVFLINVKLPGRHKRSCAYVYERVCYAATSPHTLMHIYMHRAEAVGGENYFANLIPRARHASFDESIGPIAHGLIDERTATRCLYLIFWPHFGARNI